LLAKQDPTTNKPRWNQPLYLKYIVPLQLFEFCCNLLQATWILFVNPPQDFALFTAWILLFHMISMLVLLGNFLLKSTPPKKALRRTLKTQ
jgi:hypothetical protein